MASSLPLLALITLVAFLSGFHGSVISRRFRVISEAPRGFLPEQALVNDRVLSSEIISSPFECAMRCTMQAVCVSYEMIPLDAGGWSCNLLNNLVLNPELMTRAMPGSYYFHTGRPRACTQHLDIRRIRDHVPIDWLIV